MKTRKEMDEKAARLLNELKQQPVDKKPWVGSLKKPYVWLEPSAPIGNAKCGCVLVSDYNKSGGPAFFQCPLHATAEDMYKFLKNNFHWVVTWKPELAAIIAKAESK